MPSVLTPAQEFILRSTGLSDRCLSACTRPVLGQLPRLVFIAAKAGTATARLTESGTRPCARIVGVLTGCVPAGCVATGAGGVVAPPSEPSSCHAPTPRTPAARTPAAATSATRL